MLNYLKVNIPGSETGGSGPQVELENRQVRWSSQSKICNFLRYLYMQLGGS
jgi:hypothetical protein